MPDPTDPHLLPGHCLRELRHIASGGGWLFADYFTGNYEPIGDALLNAGHIEPGVRDGHPTCEITDAGRAWLAAQEGVTWTA
jgi:hypothetical protein